MRLMTGAVAFTLMAFPLEAAEVAARQFDLHCTGTANDRSRGEKPFRETIHIDLDANTYCPDDCEAVFSIHGQSDDVITLMDRPSDGYWLVNRATWSRSTGQYAAELTATTRVFTHRVTTGRCVAGPLSIERARLSSATHLF